MYDRTAEMGMMNLVCDGLKDYWNGADQPRPYSTNLHFRLHRKLVMEYWFTFREVKSL